jgi:3-hydroxyisobutyrate dehydrogenase
MTEAAKPRVGVVGLGRIGEGAAQLLVDAGFEVFGFDVSVEALSRSAATACASPREVSASADVVLIAVFDDAQLEAVLVGEDAILEADDPAASVVSLATVSVATARWAYAEAAARGVKFLDCGVTGGRAMAEGSMVAMIGGDEGAVAAVRPVLDVFTSRVVWMGPAGAGIQSKLARNVITYGVWYMAWEGASLAAAAGVELAKLIEVVDASEPWTGKPMDLLKRLVAAEASGATLRTGDYAHKDLAAALELAAELGLELPGTVLVEERFGDAEQLPVTRTTLDTPEP